MKVQEGEVYHGELHIKEKLKVIFSSHIGKENQISNVDLFEAVYGFDPSQTSTFQREFFWNVLKKILRHMRKDEELFVIIGTISSYVLKTQEEYGLFRKSTNRHIHSLEVLKVKAKRWVDNKSWRAL